MTNRVDLDELRRLSEAATPGPWEASGRGTAGAEEAFDIDAPEADAIIRALDSTTGNPE